MPPPSSTAIRALLFDKDGTLFGFQATWGGWGRDTVLHLADGDAVKARQLAQAVRLDFDRAEFLPDSPAIAGTEEELVACLVPHMPGWTAPALRTELALRAAEVQPAEAIPLAPFLAQLRQAGLRLGVATNDGEAAARAQLRTVGVVDQFDMILGYDSGHGAKPGPGPCLAFAAALGLDPAHVAMVGDSLHDLDAGRAAGMTTVGVLTGPASAADLEGHADLVLPDIGHLREWLGLVDAT